MPARALLSKPSRKRPARLMPTRIAPMLAVASSLPADPAGYAFEYKWDGVRALCFYDGGASLRLLSRNLLDITPKYPELQPLAAALGRHQVVLDGEIVALGPDGTPSFALLQRRMHVGDPRAAERLAQQAPVWYVLFDVLHLDGRSLLERPYRQRRALLEELVPPGDCWQVTPSHVGKGTDMLRAAERHRLEGVVAKRLDSPYEPGRRSPAWIKVKTVQRQEFVVGGWIPERGSRAPGGGRVGAMLLGYYEAGRLRYAGRVGSGLRAADHSALAKQFAALARGASPFAEPVPGRGVAFLDPRLVVEVEYRRWPDGGLVQHAAYKGLRSDKPARAVVKEHVETEHYAAATVEASEDSWGIER